MVGYYDALAIVLAETPVMTAIEEALDDVLGRYLIEPVTAPFDIPRFDNTAVDGFAVRVADVQSASAGSPATLRLLGAVRAGDSPHIQIEPFTAVKVLTGSPLPSGAEAVVMKEYSAEEDGYVVLQGSVSPGENIRRSGEEFQRGQMMLPAGTRITPPVIGLLASVGISAVRVRRKPKIGLVVTGSELVAAGSTLHGGQIYDSNSAALSALLRTLPVELVRIASCADRLDMVEQEVGEALEVADVVITVGGASVGDFDFVETALKSNGVTLHFSKVAMKPGKPSIFGTKRNGATRQLTFGLPGNPVSALVCATVLVWPALQKMLGAGKESNPLLEARLGSDIRKKPGRLEFVRARLRETAGSLIAYPTRGQESHMLGGIAQANALIHFSPEAETLRTGDTVRVQRLPW